MVIELFDQYASKYDAWFRGEQGQVLFPAERQAIQREVLDAVWHVVDEELTDKQRQAFIAVRIHGVPMAEVARRMGTNRNALYKLLHDARKRIKRRMAARGRIAAARPLLTRSQRAGRSCEPLCLAARWISRTVAMAPATSL